MTRKVRDLEQQVKAQTDEMLSKVGPGGERARVGRCRNHPPTPNCLVRGPGVAWG